MFVGPALVILGVFLVYPVVNTIILSLKDARSEDFVGLDNYRFLFTDESMLRSIRNTLGWIVLVPLVAVSVGLVFATLADRLQPGRAVAKSMIFLPMAISLRRRRRHLAAHLQLPARGVRHEHRPAQRHLVRASATNPCAWLQEEPWNNLC